MSYSGSNEWKNWLDENKVKEILEGYCELKNKESPLLPRSLEYYPISYNHNSLQHFQNEVDRLGKITSPFEVNIDMGYLDGWTAWRRTDMKNSRIYYPDYGGNLYGTYKAVNLPLLDRIFKEYPSARLDTSFKFYLSTNRELIVKGMVDYSLGLEHAGRASCMIITPIDSFLNEYSILLKFKHEMNLRNWVEWRTNFEKYVSGNEYLRMGMVWGKKYDIKDFDINNI